MLNKIIQSILNDKYSNDELNQIATAIKHARHNQAVVNTFTLKCGTDVSFIHHGNKMNGRIIKVNRTTMNVLVGSQQWKVPANMLTPV